MDVVEDIESVLYIAREVSGRFVDDFVVRK